jgi:superfamily II DNA or RNA helicase
LSRQTPADRKACLIFASGVKHGRHLVSVLQEKHGIECGFVCGDTPAAERNELLARFRGEEEKRLFSRRRSSTCATSTC